MNVVILFALYAQILPKTSNGCILATVYNKIEENILAVCVIVMKSMLIHKNGHFCSVKTTTKIKHLIEGGMVAQLV